MPCVANKLIRNFIRNFLWEKKSIKVNIIAVVQVPIDSVRTLYYRMNTNKFSAFEFLSHGLKLKIR